MIKIFSPADEAELAVAKSMLESEGIPYHVKNEHFGSLYPGIAIKYINAKTVYVPIDYKDDAIALLGNFIEGKEINESHLSRSYDPNLQNKRVSTGIFQKLIEYIKKAGK